MQPKSCHCGHRFVRGFTLIELLVVVSIISLLVSILLPALQKARAQARKAACMADMRSCGQLLFMFNEEYDGRYPEHREGVPDYRWPMTMKRAGFRELPGNPINLYGTGEIEVGCIDNSKTYAESPAVGYAHVLMYNYDLYTLAKRDTVPRPMEKVGFSDGYRDGGGIWFANWNRGNYWNTYPNIGDWHNGGANLLMLDGHVEYRVKTPQNMTAEMWKVYKGDKPKPISDPLHFPVE